MSKYFSLLLIFIFFCGCQSTSANGSRPAWHSSCAQPPNFSHVQHKEQTQWFNNKRGPTKAVSLVIHGLNAKPSRMDQIVDELNKQQVDVLRVALPGHRKNLQEMRDVTTEQWLGSALQAHCIAQKQAVTKSVPLYFVGFSLGGAIISRLISDPHIKPPVEYKKMLLFAPAITPRTRSYFIKIFRIFGSSFIIDSWSPKAYQAQRGTSVAAYNALFDIVEQTQVSSNTHKLNVPTLVIMSPDDELVSYSDLREFVKERELNQWQIMTVNNKESKLEGKYSHLVIDEEAVGLREWKRISQAFLKHFELN